MSKTRRRAVRRRNDLLFIGTLVLIAVIIVLIVLSRPAKTLTYDYSYSDLLKKNTVEQLNLDLLKEGKGTFYLFGAEMSFQNDAAPQSFAVDLLEVESSEKNAAHWRLTWKENKVTMVKLRDTLSFKKGEVPPPDTLPRFTDLSQFDKLPLRYLSQQEPITSEDHYLFSALFQLKKNQPLDQAFALPEAENASCIWVTPTGGASKVDPSFVPPQGYFTLRCSIQKPDYLPGAKEDAAKIRYLVQMAL